MVFVKSRPCPAAAPSHGRGAELAWDTCRAQGSELRPPPGSQQNRGTPPFLLYEAAVVAPLDPWQSLGKVPGAWIPLFLPGFTPRLCTEGPHVGMSCPRPP